MLKKSSKLRPCGPYQDVNYNNNNNLHGTYKEDSLKKACGAVVKNIVFEIKRFFCYATNFF